MRIGERFSIRCFAAAIREFQPSLMSTYAAGATFYIVLSLIPFLIVLISLLQFLPFNQENLSFLNVEFVPKDVRDFFINTIREITDSTSIAVLPLASIGTLWSASSGIYALFKGFNAVYRRRETRNYIHVRALCLLYTVAFLILLILVLGVLVFGNHVIWWIADALPSRFFLSSFFRNCVTFAVLSFFFTLMYKTVPDRKSGWLFVIPGGVFSAVGWMGFSYLYAIYITHFGHHADLYGSLTAIVFLLIWLYACIFLVFVGAFINVQFEKRRSEID